MVRLVIVAWVYAAIGLVAAVRAVRRGERPLDAALLWLAWPLMLPLGTKPSSPPDDPVARAADRVREALASVELAAAGTGYAGLLDAQAGVRLRQELSRATQRVRAIDDELARETSHGSGSQATAHLREASQASLRAIRERDLRAMSELAELLAALRARIVLAQHSGSPAEGPEVMVGEVWSRIVGLGEALEVTRGPAAP